MVLCRTKQQISEQVQLWKAQGDKIGLVPTMGCLHQGHLSLVQQAKHKGLRVVVSIYVNPTQFNEKSDFEKYPRNEKADLDLLEGLADAVFVPSDQEMYSNQPVTGIGFGSLETVMEGSTRPGHFNGVGIVVSKLFNMVAPNYAFFGQKDFQQCAVIEQLVRDLSFPIEIIRHPIVREEDGLAMSSRNKRLTEEQRSAAPHIYKSLNYVSELLLNGQRVRDAQRKGKEYFAKNSNFSLEYLEIVDPITLKSDEEQLSDEVVVCIAAFLGEVRLIDNLLVKR